jgi:hypothetical protein
MKPLLFLCLLSLTARAQDCVIRFHDSRFEQPTGIRAKYDAKIRRLFANHFANACATNNVTCATTDGEGGYHSVTWDYLGGIQEMLLYRCNSGALMWGVDNLVLCAEAMVCSEFKGEGTSSDNRMSEQSFYTLGMPAGWLRPQHARRIRPRERFP